jgi:hypothetical protein
MAHFQQLEEYLRDKSGVDFAAFAAEGDDELVIADHPLGHLLSRETESRAERDR